MKVLATQFMSNIASVQKFEMMMVFNAGSIVSVGRRHFAASFNYQLLTLAQKSAKLWAHFSEPCITETLKGG